MTGHIKLQNTMRKTITAKSDTSINSVRNHTMYLAQRVTNENAFNGIV